MSTSFEKVSADEFARRYGWRKSAVVHRIRAGIYDGVKENGTWYVLRNAPTGTPHEVPGADYEHEAPELPWRTVPFPITWVSIATWIGFAAMVLPLALGQAEDLAAVFGIGLIAATAPRLYEGLATGTIRALYFGPMSYNRRPVHFTLHALSYLVYSVLGLIVIFISLFVGWPRAV